ncbi:MAG TPA: hypothetical protein GXX37_14225 [Clostridiaceae bacterium]|nr:hypothetical protein [Clostridiaceae bacterium]
MKEQEEIKTIFGIALIYTVITSIFSLLHKVNTLLIGSHEVLNIRIHLFFKKSTLWIIVVAAIIIILSLYVKKSNQKVSTLIAENPMIGMVVGVLVVLKGVSDLASSLPINIINIESVFEAIRHIDVFLDGTKEKMILQAVVTNAFSIVIIISQTILGVFLFKVYKKRMN